MKLSIIIVNYNVSNELKQCLISVKNSLQNIESEIFVVDNNSSDDSCEMIRQFFPTVNLIENNENVGFAKANNQAIQRVVGEYILLLNPDTIVAEDSFSKMITFADEHCDMGGLGVKMVDENGNFLPESKRGVPTPFVAFCKITGLYKLFPKSDMFNHYYLGSLPNDECNEIEILAGACMLLRKSVIDEVGCLDENYFLYGEDVDISYRILLHGYKNYYLPTTQIVHLKGVSTKKNQQESIKAFYAAMEIFVDTHFKQTDVSKGKDVAWRTQYSHLFVWFLKKCIRLCCFCKLLTTRN